MIHSDDLHILELVAWETDTHRCGEFAQYSPDSVILEAETKLLATFFTGLLHRKDLQQEFADLSWRIAVVDLRTLQAFQRRLVFDPIRSTATAPCSNDWAALTALAFGPPRSIAHEYIGPMTIQSENPDLHVRVTETGWQLHGGSPFFEVALYKGRTFLRDGYHRAYSLLRAGVHEIPAVVIEARSLHEVYFDSPNFFPESILFAPQPPMVTDFLNPSFTITHTAPRIQKTIHLPDEIQFKFIEQTKEYYP